MLTYARRYSILLAPTTIAAAEAAGLSRLEMRWRVADRVSLPALNLLSCDTGDDEIEVEVGVSPVDAPILEIAGKPAGALPPPLAALVVAAISVALAQSDAAPRRAPLPNRCSQGRELKRQRRVAADPPPMNWSTS